jgi:predicted aspartyl protease
MTVAVLLAVAGTGIIAAEPQAQPTESQKSQANAHPQWSMHELRLSTTFEINGHEVRMQIDTGSEDITLTRAAADRIGLKVDRRRSQEKVPEGLVPLQMSEECDLRLGGTTTRRRLRVVELSSDMAAVFAYDGVVGWANLQRQILHMDIARHSFRSLERIPENMDGWTELELVRDLPVLAFRVGGEDERAWMMVDTGATGGLSLTETRWRSWLRANRDAPATMQATVTPAHGVQASRIYWADRLRLGEFTVRDVPVAPSPPLDLKHYAGTLEMFALSRLEVIVDGPGGKTFVRPTMGPRRPYRHNRLGAVFTPGGPRQTDLVAHVIESGPAHQAGVRDGDVLLKIGERDVTNQRQDPSIFPLHRFWSQGAGTEIKLTLRRDEREFEVTARLRDLLPPTEGPAETETATPAGE